MLVPGLFCGVQEEVIPRPREDGGTSRSKEKEWTICIMVTSPDRDEATTLFPRNVVMSEQIWVERQEDEKEKKWN